MNDIKYTDDGSRIGLYKYETSKFKSESISIYFALPTDKEKSVARSLLLSVLKRGTQKYPTQKHINERLDELYATLVNLKNQKFDDLQLLGISADIIYSSYTDENEDLLPSVLDVISQMMFSPLLDAKTGLFLDEYVKSEKENYKSIILSQINEPRTYAAIRCREEMFSSLGIIDSLDKMCDRIDSITADELYSCYLEMVNSAKITVFYVGSRSRSDIISKLAMAFGNIEVDLFHNEKRSRLLLDDRDQANVVEEDFDATQSRLVLGFNCRVTWRDSDYYAMLLCNEILGASPISKLMMNVREKLSLCYECSSVYNSARGAIFVTTGIDAGSYELAKDAIIGQLDDIKGGRVSDEELFAAKKSIFNVYSAVSDSPSAIERFYLGRIINGIDADIESFLARIDAMTLDDVIRAAKRLNLHTVYFLRGNAEAEEGEYE